MFTDKITTDPKYEDEVSGCTACVSLIVDNKLYVVCDNQVDS